MYFILSMHLLPYKAEVKYGGYVYHTSFPTNQFLSEEGIEILYDWPDKSLTFIHVNLTLQLVPVGALLSTKYDFLYSHIYQLNATLPLLASIFFMSYYQPHHPFRSVSDYILCQFECDNIDPLIISIWKLNYV